MHSILTRDATSTRFHACERFDRCDDVNTDQKKAYGNADEISYGAISKTGKNVIYVNPVRMSVQRWDSYIRETKELLNRGESMNVLVCPASID
jgi:DNA cross-link repair 1C protein